MKKIMIMFFILALFLSPIMANGINITGNWLMVKVKSGDKLIESYFFTDFDKNGTVKIMGNKVGSWVINKTGDKIIIKSPRLRKLNGENKILELTDKKMVLEKEGIMFYYLKIDKNKIKDKNNNSNLTGVWKILTDDNSVKYIKFDTPDSFLFLHIDGGMTDTVTGSWIFNPKDKEVLIISFSPLFRGKRKILNFGSKEFIWKNNGKQVKLIRQVPEKNKIERLLFKEDDFPEDNNDEEKLPWREFQEMSSVLKNIKSVKYKKSTLVNELNVFVYSEILSEIKVDEEKQKVIFTNYTINRDNKNRYSERYKGGLNEMYNYFFPKEEPMPYRITGIETIEVPAGKFRCTVVEGFDGETKVKYWMINDKPGIYAKMITEEQIVSNKLVYSVYELTIINKR